MTEYRNKECLESKIIETARRMFIEKGFEDTNMCDIAAQVGIKRPVLHYYFRTKDKMFQAVLGSILLSLLPKIQDIIKRKDILLSEKVGLIIDEYYSLLCCNPCIPLFVMREANRNISFLVDAIRLFNLEQLYLDVRDAVQAEMDEGNIRSVPCRFVFLTFYGLITMPFMSKGICCSMFLDEGETFDDMLSKWKTHVISQMTALLQK